nr:peptidoglycan-binding protein [Tessaracoccus sp. OS52]
MLALSGCAPDVLAQPPEDEGSPTQEVSVPAERPAPTEQPSKLPTEQPTEEPTEQPAPQPAPEGTPAPTVAPTPTKPAPPPPPPAIIKVGDEGDKVRELQHRLLQIDWYQGKITPTYGEQTKAAVEGFQAKRGIAVLGYVDQVTWDKLVAMTRMPSQDEMYNVLKPGPAILAQGAKGDAVKDLQARLKQLAWYFDAVDGVYGANTVEAVKGFQGKREIPVTGEVDQRTLDRLHGMTRKPSSAELNNRPSTGSMTLDDRCLQGRVICISKAQRKLAWVVDGEIRMTMDVRFGTEGTSRETRNGTWKVEWKSRDHVSSLYDTPMPYAMFFSGGQAVHYSADFAARGYNGSSHGCVNVRDKQAVATLFDTARTGDKVVVYAG